MRRREILNREIRKRFSCQIVEKNMLWHEYRREGCVLSCTRTKSLGSHSLLQYRKKEKRASYLLPRKSWWLRLNMNLRNFKEGRRKILDLWARIYFFISFYLFLNFLQSNPPGGGWCDLRGRSEYYTRLTSIIGTRECEIWSVLTKKWIYCTQFLTHLSPTNV